MNAPALHCDTLTKSYGHGELAEPVLNGVSLSLEAGRSALLMGPSGSGKTTLLSILGCLLTPSSGRLSIGGEDVDFSQPDALSTVRRQKIGFVFQHAQLLPFLTVQDNLAVAARNAGVPPDVLEVRLPDAMERLGILAHRQKYPGQLSGGQRQRVAVARALLHSPDIVLADEPTAALDWQHGQTVVQLLSAQVREAGAALLVVTHDHRLIPSFDTVWNMDRGRLARS
jgi:ABC-type lipoprotein export system ATPase subunit